MAKVHFETSARLLTMLGDKLIENGNVALIELIKNGYDADANKVTVDFCGFNFEQEECQDINSKILIIDDGHGMAKHIIEKSFLNIATSIKHSNNEVRTSPGGRVFLGSHGIGRFSLLKLGRKITIYTKAENDKYYSLVWDFTQYNNDFVDENQLSILLSKIEVDLNEVDFEQFSLYSKKSTGTIIIIENLNEKWDIEKIKLFAKDVTTFSPILLREGESNVNKEKSFLVEIFKEGTPFYVTEDGKDVDINNFELNYLRSLIDTEVAFKIEDGIYIESSGDIQFNLTEGPHGVPKLVKINIKKFSNWETYKDHREYYDGSINCGDFKFETYIFNFDKTSFLELNKLSKDQIKFLKKYNIYLYRDGARVLPYGNAGIDWLDIERLRAETRAGDYFSQGQLVGQIFITREGNPSFQDKTSREGLIITGNEFEKLKHVYRLILEYVKTFYFDKAKTKEKTRIEAEESKKDVVSQEINKALKENADNKAVVKALKTIQAQHDKARINYNKRLDIVEQLAGAGMSIEVSSHELYSTMLKLGGKIYREQEILEEPPMIFNIDKAKKVNQDIIFLQKIALQQLDNIQKLLVSSKQRIKKINVNKEIREIISLYTEKLIDKDIQINFSNEKDVIIAETIDAVIYQTMCNLIDNSIYWLDNEDIINRRIIIDFDRQNNKIIFSDSGPGIDKNDEPYIFDAFFSGKGIKGRGLGLYISKRLLNKYDFNIRLAKEHEKIYEGATFVIELGEN